MNHHSPIEDDPQQLQHANDLWRSFLHKSKISIFLIVLVVIGLALAFVPAGS
ncbi:MAG: hypothetical protein KDI11_00750 [Alphaproteobacteria bacterium]|nr:hypothetical protein [Alphaproteobacteria bacterium]